MSTEFLRHARNTYMAANAAALDWMLNRPSLGNGFLNTKQNSLTLKDYDASDGHRGPEYIYGWIQGRGLEAIVTQAAFFAQHRPDLSMQLDAKGRILYEALKSLQRTNNHAYFCYDNSLRPILINSAELLHPQDRPDHIFTYSDAFVAKGLVAAAHRYSPAELDHELAYFDRIILAIEDGRFQMNENERLSDAALAAQSNDFGPRMILLGAASMLSRIGLSSHATYADQFIAHILEEHFDAKSSLLCNVADEESCNVGHGIEFVGFALDYLSPETNPALITKLERILLASFAAGFVGPGIALSICVSDGRVLSPFCPWWSLAEAVRAASLAYWRTGNSDSLDVWRQAHNAFFSIYWQNNPPIAYQTMTRDGPVDFIPATPDLDPGYHTGLSLLAAITVADALLPASYSIQAPR